MTLQQLIPTLQVAIGPVILISGVGLLILSMTNRLGRTIDRSRKTAITLSGVAVLLDALLMILLFLGALVDLPVAVALALLFAACLTALIGSIIYFLRDVNLALRALAHELEVGTFDARGLGG
jgi:hypothetical protein